MCVIAVLKVASRYVGGGELSWAEEGCTLLFVYLVFVGAASGVKAGEHFAVEVLVEKAPRWLQRWLVGASQVLVVAFGGLLLWYGVELVLTGRASVTPALELPRSVGYAAVPVGGLLIVVRGLGRLVGTVRGERGEAG
ncbi:MAG: TRAP transporter small permease [Sedimentisphaerales bacterium]|nr:TRAP transporter small permease [Sedimentisphaerales bacterium]